jgi:hypothetical protein
MSQPKVSALQTDIDLSGYATTSSVTNLFSTAGGRVENIQYFTSSGTFTVPTGITKVKVQLIGGGGGGSTSIGSGAGGAGYAEGVYPVTPGQNITVTIGAAGAVNVTGGTSSFGSFCTATGSSINGVNGTATGGQLNMSGYSDPGINAGFCTGVYGVLYGRGGNFNNTGQPGLCVVQW